MYKNILEYLEITAARLPDKTAFSDGKDNITFGELLKKSQAIGSFLIKSGCRGKPIPIVMDKHPFVIAAFLGVIYAGCFYVPIDGEMPPLRAGGIVKSLNSQFIITDNNNAAFARGLGDGEVLIFDDISSAQTDNFLLYSVRSAQIDTDPIYIVFTSGSTGVPKGVAASHRSVIDYAESLSEALSFGENNIFGNQTPLYFDAPLKEILPTIKFGATTYLIPRKLFMFPVRLVEFLNEYKINTICWVVSALTMISALGTFEKIKPEYLTTVAFGSEVFPVKQFNIWYDALPHAVFFNLYGPTECTGMSAYYQVEGRAADGEPIPIGQPFSNTRILLINENGAEAGASEQGEIYISGTCVTLGYFNNQDKTNEAYVQNPLISAYRDIVYKTGDIARRNLKGELVFISRKDYQIKHMGHRIELGEIEAAADHHPKISRSCCIYDDENKKILMFYIGSADCGELAKYLKDYLPRYMLPSSIRKLDNLPLTPNGKLDRLALKNLK